MTKSHTLSVFSWPMGCAALEKSITMPPYYQAEEKFQSKESFLALSNVFSIWWTVLWDFLVKKSPNISVGKLPQLLDVEKIDLYRLVYKLETVRKGILVWKDQLTGTSIWSSFGGVS